jgi:hypothetical protein
VVWCIGGVPDRQLCTSSSAQCTACELLPLWPNFNLDGLALSSVICVIAAVQRACGPYMSHQSQVYMPFGIAASCDSVSRPRVRLFDYHAASCFHCRG